MMIRVLYVATLLVNQVPEVVHYRESILDMSIIIFILGINMAEFLCHILIFRARLFRIVMLL